MKRCPVCRVSKELTEFNKHKSRGDGHQSLCRKCDNELNIKRSRDRGHISMSENKTCASYLGVAIAERLVSHLFNDVHRMPYRNPGFDFICAKDKKIDVKSSCIRSKRGKKPYWQFNIRYNQIADYFLLLAFDNREDMELQYQWLLPGHVVNHLKGVTITISTIDKWDEWRQPIGPALTCCNTIKEAL